jgi:hypothetical protein
MKDLNEQTRSSVASSHAARKLLAAYAAQRRMVREAEKRRVKNHCQRSEVIDLDSLYGDHNH